MNNPAPMLDLREESVIQDAQARLDVRRRAWMREKRLLERTRSDWNFAHRPAAQEVDPK